MPRKGWVIFIALMLIPAGLGVAVYVKLREIAVEMEADVRALAATRVERPALEPVSPGGFEARVKPLLLRAARRGPAPWNEPWLQGKDGEIWADVRNEDRPLWALPVEAKAQLEELRDWYLEVLSATHSELPAQPVERLAAALDDNRGIALQHAAKLAAIDQLLLIEAKRPGEALRLCIDSLALARDAAKGGTLLDSMIGAAIVGIVRHPCARSIDNASAEEQRAALADLRLVRSGCASNAEWMRNERVVQEMLLCTFVSDDELDQLPAGSGAWAKFSSHSGNSGLAGWALALRAWPALKRRDDGLLAAMALPAAERAKAVERVQRDTEGPLKDISTDFERFALRIDRRDLMLDQLQCLLELAVDRAETGGWHPPGHCAPMTYLEPMVAVVTLNDPMPLAGKTPMLQEYVVAPELK
ncbi:MAG: hypothetical protein QM723_38180 [Myxococcaceae bacterium]